MLGLPMLTTVPHVDENPFPVKIMIVKHLTPPPQNLLVFRFYYFVA